MWLIGVSSEFGTIEEKRFRILIKLWLLKNVDDVYLEILYSYRLNCMNISIRWWDKMKLVRDKWVRWMGKMLWCGKEM